MNIKYIYITIALILGSTTQTIAQPVATHQPDQIDLLNFTPPHVYQDQMVIRVQTTTQPQLDAMLNLVESVWSEHTGIGQLDIQIKQTNLNAITSLGIQHEVLIDDLQTHTTLNWNRMVEIERQNQHRPQLGATVHDDLWFENYKQLNEITDYINNIVALRPDLATTEIIGQSWEGRDMFSVTISAPDTPENPRADRPVVYIFSTVHAREWIAPMTTTYFASKFVEDYDTNPRITSILDSTRIVIVPVGNPDGYLYTWSDYRYWRKTRREGHGVDINRNWEYEWGGSGSSGSTGSDTYRGTHPFSEPETQALRDKALSYNEKLAAHIDYHSYSQLILYPFGFAGGRAPEPDRTYFRTLSRELASDIRSIFNEHYSAIQATSLYAAAGNSIDWFYGQLGVESITFELRTTSSFNPSPDHILPNAQENYYAFQRYVERVLEPVVFYFDPPDHAESNTPTPVTIEIHDGLAEQQPTDHLIMARIAPDQSYSPIEMTEGSRTARFEADLPAGTCGTPIEYYFQATRADGSIHTHPSDGATHPLTILPDELVAAHTDDFELDSGWIVGTPEDTATDGVWTRMDPEETNYPSSGNIIQTGNDHTQYGNLCWVTNGYAGVDAYDNDVDGGFTTLTSPLLDALITGNDPHLSFWYWWHTSHFSSSFILSISNNDGQSWRTVDNLPSSSSFWSLYTFRIQDEIEPTNQMRFRFTVNDYGVDNTVESAIDDLQLMFTGCPSANPADLNNDAILNLQDINIFLNAFATNNPIGDFNNDSQLDYFDVSEFLINFSQGMP